MSLNHFIILLYTFYFTSNTIAQINENFEQGNLNNWNQAPGNRWQASTNTPISGSYSLQHSFDNQDSDIDYISTNLGYVNPNEGNISWEFKIRYEYNPSSSNNWGVYLFSDKNAEEIKTEPTQNGYIIGVNTSGSTDIIKLWRADNGSNTQLINTELNWQESIGTNQTCAIKVTKSESGTWTIIIDTLGTGENYINYGTATDNTYQTGDYFVIAHQYTSSADQKLFFDDIIVNSDALNPNNTDSYISDPDNQVPGIGISSLINQEQNAQEIFKFKIIDTGSGDGLPTMVKQMSFIPGSSNNASWEQSIQNLVFFKNQEQIPIDSLTINNSNITVYIPINNLNIPDGENKEISVKAVLKNNNLNDNDSIQLKIPAENTGFKAYNQGSGFALNFNESTISESAYIMVETQLLYFNNLPNKCFTNQAININSFAGDANQNIDIDFNQECVLTLNQGVGNLSTLGNNPTNFSEGTGTFVIKYDTTGLFNLKIKSIQNPDIYNISNNINGIEVNSTIDESFIDGDFTFNPQWYGNTTAFRVNPNKQLELFANPDYNPSPTYLCVPVKNTNDTIQWEFYLKNNFNPSLSNNSIIYLISESENLNTTTAGYYIKIGGISGDEDTGEFYKLENEEATLLVSGIPGIFSENPEAKFKITRSPDGLWSFFTEQNYQYQELFTYEDTSGIPDFFYYGFQCNYSATNAESKFIFDDIYYGTVRHDTLAPEIDTIKVLSDSEIEIHFNENIQNNNLSNENINCFPSCGDIENIIFLEDSQTRLHIKFSESFIPNTTYNIEFENISDYYNNSQNATGSFIFKYIGIYELIINEIMPDPSPAVYLPEVDYLELFNPTNRTINIKDCKLKTKVSDDGIILPNKEIAPESFLLLSPANAYFQENTNNYLFLNELSLNNESEIILLNKYNQLIHRISYNKNSYQDDFKSEGGWSLELIDNNSPCNTNNLIASESEIGGTPGAANSVSETNQDNAPPELIRAICITKDTLQVFFSEIIDSTSLTKNNFSILDDENISITDVFYKSYDYQNAYIVLSNTITTGVRYTLQVNPFNDCAGNLSQNTSSCDFGYPEKIETGDLLISELLFNPFPNEYDYIEIFNKSNKIFDTKDLRFALKNENNEIDNITIYSEYSFLIFPEDYIVLSENTKSITENYYCKYPEKLVPDGNLPSFNNTEGHIYLLNKSLNIIDEFYYNDEMHYEFLSSTEGVALERINFNNLTQDKSNRASASESVGYGTPTYQNSNFTETIISQELFTSSPEVFSPDNDGKDDFVQISFNTSGKPYTATITIYDSMGRAINYLINKEYITGIGAFIWKGDAEEGNICPSGIYIIYIELLNSDGTLKQIKKHCVIATKFN